MPCPRAPTSSSTPPRSGSATPMPSSTSTSTACAPASWSPTSSSPHRARPSCGPRKSVAPAPSTASGCSSARVPWPCGTGPVSSPTGPSCGPPRRGRWAWSNQSDTARFAQNHGPGATVIRVTTSTQRRIRCTWKTETDTVNNMASGRKLVIVESPAKARTIAGYLGSDWDVEASVGHIRDIPTPSEMPAEIKKGPFGKFGVNIEDDFEPYYVVDADKKKKVAELRRLLKDADELYLATDEDREGEAIAWHLLETLQPKVPVKRMVFHEITKEAIQRAAATTRDLDTRLVDAQETRRILDRLYGYEVSPVLWRKVKAGLSAGRVQSVATRLVVERERERMAFRAASYWDVEGDFTPSGPDADSAAAFPARLVTVDGARVAGGRDFDDRGALTASARSA